MTLLVFVLTVAGVIGSLRICGFVLDLLFGWSFLTSKICWFNLYLVVLESLIDCGFIVEMKRTTWYDNLRSKQIFIQNENMKQITEEKREKNIVSDGKNSIFRKVKSFRRV